jgi:hypothetical protein
MHITVNSKQYIANITHCGEAITLSYPNGEEITVIPREKNWEETATAAIIAIVKAQEHATAA